MFAAVEIVSALTNKAAAPSCTEHTYATISDKEENLGRLELTASSSAANCASERRRRIEMGNGVSERTVWVWTSCVRWETIALGPCGGGDFNIDTYIQPVASKHESPCLNLQYKGDRLRRL